MWQNCVYNKLDVEEWHEQECLLGECQECGVNILPLCPSEMANNVRYKLLWRCFETRIVGQTYDGQPRKWIKEVFKETSTKDFLT